MRLSYIGPKSDTADARTIHRSAGLPALLSCLCYFPAAVCWKGPSKHLNPTSVEIYAFGRRTLTMSAPSPTSESIEKGGKDIPWWDHI